MDHRPPKIVARRSSPKAAEILPLWSWASCSLAHCSRLMHWLQSHHLIRNRLDGTHASFLLYFQHFMLTRHKRHRRFWDASLQVSRTSPSTGMVLTITTRHYGRFDNDELGYYKNQIRAVGSLWKTPVVLMGANKNGLKCGPCYSICSNPRTS